MSAAVSSMQHQPGAGANPNSRLGNSSPVENKRSNLNHDESSRSSPQSYPSKLNQQTNASSGNIPTSVAESLQTENPTSDSNDPRDAARDDGPPEGHNGTPGDYFSMPRPSRLDQEPNPFEQSFASGGTSGPSGDPLSTPKAILPPVTAMTSPAPLLGGNSYNWGPHSLRSGPLSPAMLQGPTNPSNLGYDHIRSGLTPNESGIRSGLTPGGTGPMFPVPSPSTSQLFFGGSTPGTMEFQKTALSAARKSHPPPPLIPPSTQEIKMDANGQSHLNQAAAINQPNPHSDPQQKPRQPSDPFNDQAHNAAYMLAQLGGQPGQYQQQQLPHMQPSSMQNGNMSMESSPNLAKRVAVNNANTANQNRSFSGPSAHSSVRGASDMSPDHSDSEDEHQNGRKRNTKGRSNTNTGKRKNEDTNNGKGGGSAKKTKNSNRSGMSGSDDGEEYEENEHGETHRKDGKKMTEEEKRKNFLERNRVAALKCRQRKKQWLANLQQKVELYGTENDNLNATVQALREEIVSLKTLLLAHKDCPVARANGISMDGPTIGEYSHIPLMQTGYPAMMSQGVMHQQPGERRFS